MNPQPIANRLSIARLGLALLLVAAVMAIMVITMGAAEPGHAAPVQETPPPKGAVALAYRDPFHTSAAGKVITVMTNTWSYSTIGLVYDPDRDVVRYAHESQSSRHNPTLYDVASLDYTVLFSAALSTQNPGWPWQIDNRTGAGYDFVTQHYFVPDYNGDLSYADDNIVEIDADGRILNAWEMDDEVGSNDSSDGSEIDRIIDIAVVPGAPTRYFVTAAYDEGIVYEITLTKTGSLWTPNSWATVMTYTGAISETFRDNLGIDYDAEHERLYHSGWHTTTILITDLEMNPITETAATFDCPGAGGYNSGVTFIEGSNPPEVWVTDFSSDKTTRCEAPGEPEPIPGWDKVVGGIPWATGLSINRETSETFQVTDVITAGRPFTLTESWDDSRLRLTAASVQPPLADVLTGTGTLTVKGSAATPDVVTVTKQYQVEPCTWTQAVVSEILEIEETFYEERPFTVTKQAPQLHIDSDYQPAVLAGGITTFTLTYGNTGGFENDVVITNTFPITAPILYADPAPDSMATDGRWARWDVGGLATDDQGSIDVYVYISEALSPGTKVPIWDGIHNHVGETADDVETTFEVLGSAAAGWVKSIDGIAWSPGISTTKESYETFTVVDVITTPQAFILSEAWFTSELTLADWSVDPPAYAPYVSTPQPGLLTFTSPPVPTAPLTLTKVFTVASGTWPQAVLWEQLFLGGSTLFRPVLIHKDAPRLELSAENPAPEIHGGEVVTYTLTYTNTGGYEERFRVRSDFPAGAVFTASVPAPTTGAAGDLTAEWVFTDGLTTGQTGTLTINAQIAEEVPPGTSIGIANTIFNHASIPQDLALVTYTAGVPAWEKRVNGQPWSSTQRTPINDGESFTITEVITTEAAFTLIDRWNDTHLTLLEATPSDGSVVSTTGGLAWTVPVTAPETVVLTKRFRAEAFTSTHTVLGEDLYVGGVVWEQRPVFLERAVPDLRLRKDVSPASAGPGETITYTLTFLNEGSRTATGVVITDHVPASLTVQSVISSGVAIVNTGATPAYVWQVADLDPNEGGVIILTGVLSSPLAAGNVVNTAEIACAEVEGAQPANSGTGSNDNNHSDAVLAVRNVAPEADAGPDQQVSNAATVILDGSGSSDANGDTLTYYWTQTSGPTVVLDDATAAAPTFTAPGDPAQLAFSLVVTDNLGLADPTPDMVTITVGGRIYLPLVMRNY